MINELVPQRKEGVEKLIKYRKRKLNSLIEESIKEDNQKNQDVIIETAFIEKLESFVVFNESIIQELIEAYDKLRKKFAKAEMDKVYFHNMWKNELETSKKQNEVFFLLIKNREEG